MNVSTPLHPGMGRLVLITLSLLLALAMNVSVADELTDNMVKIDELRARDGDAEAQLAMGARYEDGSGVKKDLKRALHWYKQAANKGNTEAQYKLGEFYEKGRGVAKNARVSRIWYTKAAAKGHSRARAKLQSGQQAPAKAKTERKAESKKTQKTQASAAQTKNKQRPPNNKKTQTNQPSSRSKTTGKAAPAPPKVKAAPAVVAQANEEKAAQPVQPVKPAPPRFPDLRSLILNTHWQRQGVSAAELLPSSVSRCLKSNDQEILCFSQPRKRRVNNTELSYTVKTTLSDFSDDGQFTVRYLFNVTQMKPSAGGPQQDPSGLRVKQGWQQPPLMMRCQAQTQTTLRCEREGWNIVDFTAR